MIAADPIHIQPIQVLNVRVFLIRTPASDFLVDAGIPFQERRIMRSLRSLAVDPARIRAILLTHGHLDHIGCLAYLQGISGAEVICHASIAHRLETGTYETAVPRVLPWKVLNQPLHLLLSRHLRPVAPDLVFEEELDLRGFGLPGRLIHTPGHSPGSVSVLLESGSCLIGDLLRETSPGTYDTGLFYNSRAQIMDSLARISAAKPERIYLSHGTIMSGEELEVFLQDNGDLSVNEQSRDRGTGID